MSNNSYFAHYQSPNIVIVPTVSFPPTTENNTNQATATSSEPISKVFDEPSPSGSNWYQETYNEAVNMNHTPTKAIESTSTPECSYFKKSPPKINEGISTKHQKIIFKFRSRNNLVDLTGFNMLKRDSASSLTKYKDFRRKANTMIEPVKTTNDKKEQRDRSDIGICKRDVLSNKQSLKLSNKEYPKLLNKDYFKSTKPTSSQRKENVANDESSQSKEKTTDMKKEKTTDMKNEMKIYFKQLWNQTMEKLDKAEREKSVKKLKSIKSAKKDSKSLNLASSQSKETHQNLSKDPKNLKNKIIDGSKKIHELENKKNVERSRKYKSETNTSISKDLKNRREKNLSPITIKKHKEFPSSIPHKKYDENKYKNIKKSKTENLSDKKIRITSSESVTKKLQIKNKVDERKKLVKNEPHCKVNNNKIKAELVETQINKRSKNQANVEKAKFIKSVVQVNDNVTKNPSPSKCVDRLTDLRSKLSRKRKLSECFAHSQHPVEDKLERDNLVITVKQDVKTDPKKTDSLMSNANKPKTKKCKKIKLIINIECNNSDSDDSDDNLNKNCKSPPDLSFLDDFNVDEIVDSLSVNQSHVERRIKIPTGDTKSQSIYNINEKYNKKNESKLEERVNNDVKLKTTNVKKEETSLDDGQTIVLGDKNIDQRYIAKTVNEKEFMTKTEEYVGNIEQDTNNISDIIEIPYEENIQEVIMDLCNDSNDSIQEVIDITDDSPQCEKPKDKLLAGEIKLSESHKCISSVARIFELITMSNKNKDVDSKCTIENSHDVITKGDNKTKKLFLKREDTNTIPLTTVANTEINVGKHLGLSKTVVEKADTRLQHLEDPIEASLKTMFNPIEQNNTGVGKNVIEQLNSLDNNLTEPNKTPQSSKDAVEASLETMFQNIEQNGSIHKQVEKNRSDIINEKDLYLQKPKDALEASLATIFNGGKQENTINQGIKQLNLSSQHMNRETDVLQTVQETVITPPKTKNNKVTEKSNENDKHKTEYSEQSVVQILPETIEKISTQKNYIILGSTKPTHAPNSHIKETILQISRSKPTVDILADENVSQKSNIIPRCKTDINVKENIEHLPKFKNPVQTSHGKPNNNREKKKSKYVPPSQRHSFKRNNRARIREGLSSGEINKNTLRTTKSSVEHQTVPQIDIAPPSYVSHSNKTEAEHLEKSNDNIIALPKKTMDDNKQKTDIKNETKLTVTNVEFIKSPIQNTEPIIPENALETGNDNIQHQVNITTNAELLNTFKDIKLKPDDTSTTGKIEVNGKKSIAPKPNDENKKEDPPVETVNNNTLKLKTTNNDISESNDPNTKITNKKSESEKHVEKTTNIKQNQVDSNQNVAIDCGKIDDQHTKGKNEITFDKVPNKTPYKYCSFVEKLEGRIPGKVSSLINKGRFSTIYKVQDGKGNTFAVKKNRVPAKGRLIERILLELQQHRSRSSSNILYLMKTFEVEGDVCLLTEYYPKNLEQALTELQRGFHIDLVQILSKQLVDAVTMLTNYNIIHSDIKPSHILLNSAHTKLKLSGFDRSNYRSDIIINPSSATSSYRAPEVILGFSEDHRIDVWSTAAVMFEMATNEVLFPGYFNNEILFQQISTLGSFDWSMIEQSKFRGLYFNGTSFIQRFGRGKKPILIHCFQRNKSIRRQLLEVYHQQWAEGRTKWQITNDTDKIETLIALLEQMLVLDPRQRLPIQFVGASEFIHDAFA